MNILTIVMAVPIAALSGCLPSPQAALKPSILAEPRGKIFVASSQPAPVLEAAFRHDARWRGADAAFSIPLSVGRTLWIFQDSWVVPAGAERRGDDGRMVRNSLALFGGRDQPVEFHFSERQGEPAPAVAPDDWIWPRSGVRVGDTLLVFADRMMKASGLGFASQGSLLYRVTNVDGPFAGWQWDGADVPFFRRTTNGELKLGAATVPVGAYVYMYGGRENWERGPGGRDVILARAPMEMFAKRDFLAWEFYAGDWVSEIDLAAALFADAATEMSVSRLEALDTYVAVYTHRGNSPRIVARFAPNPEGPWSDALELYACPEPQWRDGYFTYAAKAHPELTSQPDELIITYVSNSMNGIADQVADERLYWPRFVRVRLQR